MNKIIQILILGIFSYFVSPLSCYTQTIEFKIDSIFLEQDFQNSPGYAVLISKGNDNIYRKAFGYANLEHEIKLTPDHIFRIGSITKQFTACAILKLEEEGKLSVKDEITKYIKDYPTKGNRITIEHLLTHTSGIKSFTGMNEWDSEFQKREIKVKEMIDFFKNEPFDFKPGEKFSYNNSGYFLLGYIIEIVSGKTYEEYLNESFFNPLGLESTFYGNPEIILKNRVNGYQLKDNILINAPYIDMSQPYAAGSLMSTVDDLKKWYFSVMEGKVLKKESLEKAFSKYKLNDGNYSSYGYGWFIDNIEQTDIIWHSGGINGFRANSIFIPKNNVLVIVLSNNMNNPSIQIARKIAEITIKNNL